MRRPPMSDRPESLLRRLVAGDSLRRAETEALVGRIVDAEFAETMVAALLIALACKGETIEEITGAVEAMRARVRRVPVASDGLIDTCGTGGDGLGTFNVSTAAAIVAAAGGARVAKHGNRSVSSDCGSADVLEALGVPVETTPDEAARVLGSIGIAFLFAPAFHPAMRAVMPVRRALGVRTLFNLLGPLTNPAGVRRQVLGIYSAELVEPIGEVLRQLGAEHALVVHGEDGQDEISTTGKTQVAEVKPSGVQSFELSPEDLGVSRARVADLAGGGPEENAETMRGILAGSEGAVADAVRVNAAAALYVAGTTADISDGVELAGRLITEGAALAKLDEMVAGAK